MRIVFMGTPDFAVPSLMELSKVHEICAVFTKPDKQRGRGNKVTYSEVKEAALEIGAKVYQPERVRDKEYVDILKEINPDVIVVIAFGQILSKEILDLPKYGCINVHASLLPKYRGAAPIQWAILNGEKETGVTTMYMAEGVDTGDIIETSVIEIDENETGGGLFDKLALLGAKLIISTLDKIENNTATRTKQDEDNATYAGKITKELGHIDYTKSAKSIERAVRGLYPWPCAFSFANDNQVKILSAEDAADDGTLNPGDVIKADKTGIYVKTGDGALVIKELQFSGKKRMSVEAYLNGHSFDIKHFD